MSKRLTNKENVRGLNEGKGDYYDTEKVQLQKETALPIMHLIATGPQE